MSKNTFSFRIKGTAMSLMILASLICATQILAGNNFLPPIINMLFEEDVWSPKDGVYGIPNNTFTLPAPYQDLYYPDVQASFPNVDWQNIDRLYIPAGHYRLINIGNLPVRSEDNKLIITNIDGQVRVGGLEHYYVMVLKGGANWVLTGRYDPVSKTGDSDYPGHRGGKFANSRDTYGFLLDDEFIHHSGIGLDVGGRATNFELEYIEIRNMGFAGMSLKTDKEENAHTAHMTGVSIHDCYIHDTISEGIYAGSTQSYLEPQHQLRDWSVYNNRLLRTGTEALQMGQLAGHNKIFNNVIGPAALDWRAAFQPNQDKNLQLRLSWGLTEVYNNILIGSADNYLNVKFEDDPGPKLQEDVGLKVHDNYFSGTRNYGVYIGPFDTPTISYSFERNIFRNWTFTFNEIIPRTTESSHLIRIQDSVSSVSLVDNTWSAPGNLVNNMSDANTVNGNISGSGNSQSDTPRVQFEESGLPADFDYLNLELWTDVASLHEEIKNPSPPVTYPQDFIVLHLGKPYTCLLEICSAGLVPDENPNVWSPLGFFVDDVRTKIGTEHTNYGLTPNP